MIGVNVILVPVFTTNHTTGTDENKQYINTRPNTSPQNIHYSYAKGIKFRL